MSKNKKTQTKSAKRVTGHSEQAAAGRELSAQEMERVAGGTVVKILPLKKTKEMVV